MDTTPEVARDLVAAFLSAMVGRTDDLQILEECRRILDAKSPLQRLTARDLPVCRYWTPALAVADSSPAFQIAQALTDTTPVLCWTQNPGYTASNIGPEFLENYGYAELIGSNGLFESEGVAIGVLLLGPETHYPEHFHPAREDYFVVSGHARWSLDEEIIDAKPGEFVSIPSGVRHATTTGNQPLVAIYFWDRDVSVRARLV